MTKTAATPHDPAPGPETQLAEAVRRRDAQAAKLAGVRDTLSEIKAGIAHGQSQLPSLAEKPELFRKALAEITEGEARAKAYAEVLVPAAERELEGLECEIAVAADAARAAEENAALRKVMAADIAVGEAWHAVDAALAAAAQVRVENQLPQNWNGNVVMLSADSSWLTCFVPPVVRRWLSNWWMPIAPDAFGQGGRPRSHGQYEPDVVAFYAAKFPELFNEEQSDED